MASNIRSAQFDQAVEAELPVLRRIAQRLAGSVDDAEDLVQSTVMHALRSHALFDGQHLRSWLITIMRNRQRSLWRRLKLVREDEMLEEDTATELGFWASVHDRLEADEIVRALDCVSEPLRMAVLLCDVEDMTYEEAAAAMGVPIGTVRSRLFRGRKQLRGLLMQGGGAR
jgi:RNA polymerase sigma-70 factor (ECF subfamily)